MAILNTKDAYGLASKILHWLILVLLALMLMSGYFLVDNQPKPHEIMGKVVLALAVIRLVLRFMGTAPTHHPGHGKWEVHLARLTHWALYVVLIVHPLSGWMMVSAGDFAETAPLPKWLAPEGLADFAFDLHETMPLILLGIVGLHIAGALKHAVIDRDGTLRRMWFGKS